MRLRLPGLALPTLVAALLAAAPRPTAAGCPLPTDAAAELADVPDASRLAFLREALRGEVWNMKLWTGLWSGGYLLLTTGQVALANAAPGSERPDWWIGASGPTVGLISVLALPNGVMEHGLLFEAQTRALAPGGDPCTLIARGERWLELDAGDEAFGTGWLVHVGNVVVNAAMALAIGFGYGHWLTAAINAGVGLAIGEAMIWTQPTALIDAWERYRTAGGADGW
jgi:hypothetical protein